jgi:hypothetical protein
MNTMEFRNPDEAFENAISAGALSTTKPHAAGLHEDWPCACPWFGYAGDFMYMYSEEDHDYFKHIDSRKYVRVKVKAAA